MRKTTTDAQGQSRKAMQAWAALMAARRELGDVMVAEVLLMLSIQLQPGVSQRELQATLGLPKSSISKYIWSMVQDERVTMSVDPLERRRKVLHLTPKGETIMARITGELR